METDEPKPINPLQIAADSVELANQFRTMALDYARIALDCVEERRKTNERLDKVCAMLVASGILPNMP
jgi:hypothetical protein